MKPFLGIDVTNTPEKAEINGEEFLVIRANVDYSDEADKPKKKKSEKYVDPLPLVPKIIRIVSGAFSVAFLAILIRWYVKGTNHIRAMFNQYSWVFLIGCFFALVWLALVIVGGILENKQAKAEEKRLREEEAAEAENAPQPLETPDSAADVDLLAFNYVIENEKVVAVMASEDSASEYFSYSMKLFCDDEFIYLATLDEKYAIPKASFVGISTVNDQICIPDWNKDTPPTKGEYKKFGLSVDNLNRVIIPSYHVLEFENAGEKWGIYFPNYELPAIEAATDLRAE